MAKEVKYRPATMSEIEDRDTDLYMNGERVWVFMIHRSGSIGEEEHKLDYITLTNMKKVQPEDLQVIDDTLKGQDELPESPLMRYYGDLKSKHKDAILLFRCGDFYETYYEDAHTVSKLLGITLTRRGGNGYYMAGFPHHALDTYLPRIIRAGHRVAICDCPTEPPKKKRGITETINETSETKSEETMAKTMTAQDYVGKTVSIKGSDAKYVIKSVDGDKLMTDFYRAKDAQPMPCPLPWATLEAKLKEGVYCIEDAVQGSSTSEAAKPSAKVQGSSSADDVEEVDDIKVEPAKTVEMPKAEKKGDKPKGKTTDKADKTDAAPKGGRYTFKTYTRPNKSGGTKTLGRIDGLQEGDEWLEREVAEKLHASPMYDRNEDGTKTWWLSFGKRYVDAGRKVCEAMNAGKTIDEMQAIVDAQTDENHRLAEERRAKREAKADEPKGRQWTDKDVLDLIERVADGDAEAMRIINEMKKAA